MEIAGDQFNESEFDAAADDGIVSRDAFLRIAGARYMVNAELHLLEDGEPATDEVRPIAESQEEALENREALHSIHRHMEAFAPSGIIDLSERGVRSSVQLDFAALGDAVAAGVSVLDLAHNQLGDLSGAVTRPLKGLTDLDLSHNFLEAFPPALCSLPSLMELNLSHNLIGTVSVSTELCTRGLPLLETLLLQGNRLTSLPACVAGLRRLERLDLSENKLAMGSTAAGVERLARCCPLLTEPLRVHETLRCSTCPTHCSVPLRPITFTPNALQATTRWQVHARCATCRSPATTASRCHRRRSSHSPSCPSTCLPTG